MDEVKVEPWRSPPTTRQMGVMGCVILTVILIGAKALTLVEQPAAALSRSNYDAQLRDLMDRGKFSPEQRAIVKQIMSHHGEHWCLPHMANEDPWSFDSSVYFVVVLITTVGYGDLAPESFAGKIIAVLISLLGIPLVLSFTVPVARRLITCLTTEVRRHYRTRALECVLEAVEMRRGAKNERGKIDYERRLPMPISSSGLKARDIWAIELTTSFAILVLIVLVVAAIVPVLVLNEGWAQEDAWAFSWYTMTTVGLGDKTISLRRPWLASAVLVGLVLLGTAAAQAMMIVLQHLVIIVDREIFSDGHAKAGMSPESKDSKVAFGWTSGHHAYREDSGETTGLLERRC